MFGTAAEDALAVSAERVRHALAAVVGWRWGVGRVEYGWRVSRKVKAYLTTIPLPIQSNPISIIHAFRIQHGKRLSNESNLINGVKCVH